MSIITLQNSKRTLSYINFTLLAYNLTIKGLIFFGGLLQVNVPIYDQYF